MNKNVIVALIAGLLGGLVTRYISPPPAFAQNQPPVAKEIRAQSFVLVDQSDHAVGTFMAEPVRGTPGPFTPIRIVLRDFTGREIWSAGGSPIQPLSAR